MSERVGDSVAELRAACEACALVDRGEWTRLQGNGRDLRGLLQRLSTADLTRFAEGGGGPTVLTTPKGRIVERLFVSDLGTEGLLLVAGPGASGRVLEHLGRYTFAEETGLDDRTAATCHLAVIGPAAERAVAAADLPSPGKFGAARVERGGTRILVLGHDGLSADGCSIVAPKEAEQELHRALLAAVQELGGRAIGSAVAECWRQLRGHPASGSELNEEHNPLEAGLWDAVSFDKGCYVGQEVVARLNTYDKVSRKLVGLEALDDLDAAELRDQTLHRQGRRIGEATSAVAVPGRRRPIGLGFVKQRAVEPGAVLEVGEAGASKRVKVIELPFAILGASNDRTNGERSTCDGS